MPCAIPFANRCQLRGAHLRGPASFAAIIVAWQPGALRKECRLRGDFRNAIALRASGFD
jgi:hypothetical protein